VSLSWGWGMICLVKLIVDHVGEVCMDSTHEQDSVRSGGSVRKLDSTCGDIAIADDTKMKVDDFGIGGGEGRFCDRCRRHRNWK
jgi:hypothetical protein